MTRTEERLGYAHCQLETVNIRAEPLAVNVPIALWRVMCNRNRRMIRQNLYTASLSVFRRRTSRTIWQSMDLTDIPAAREHTQRLLRDLHERAVTLCILDLELALSLLDRADTSPNPEIAARDRQNAWDAGFVAQRQLSHLILDEAQEKRIERLLSQLRLRLQRLGLPLHC